MSNAEGDSQSPDVPANPMAARKPPQNLRKVLVVMLVGVCLYGAVAVYRGLDKMGSALGLFHWSAFLAACGLAFSNYILRFLKWEFYLSRLAIRGVPKWDSFLIFLSGFVLTVTPGKVGEVFKSAVLHERFGVPIARTAPIVLAERITDVLGIVVLIAIGSMNFAGGWLWAGIGTALVVLILTIISSRTISLALIGRTEALPGKLGKLGPKLREAYGSLSVLVKPSNLVLPTIISIFAWLLECLALWVILHGFGQTIAIAPCLFFYATSTLMGAVIPVPGGLGITEGALMKQMTALGGINTNISTAAMILVRFATLWFAVLVGFCALGLLKLRKIGAAATIG